MAQVSTHCRSRLWVGTGQLQPRIGIGAGLGYGLD
ncbi:hypothetical protein HDE79_004267 [Rhodanobacter sp. MP1X3]|nr:hypothetical protein [Rhodanobacter sp. MP1X3]